MLNVHNPRQIRTHTHALTHECLPPLETLHLRRVIYLISLDIADPVTESRVTARLIHRKRGGSS